MTELSEAPQEQRRRPGSRGWPGPAPAVRASPGPDLASQNGPDRSSAGQNPPGRDRASPDPGPPPGPATLTAAYERCRQLNRRHGRSYYLATRLLPDWKRPHVHALYGFARYADEIVDDLGHGLSPAERRMALTAGASGSWRPAGGPLRRPGAAGGRAHRALLRHRPRRLRRFLRSMRMDLDRHRLRRPTTTCSATWRVGRGDRHA